MLLSYNLFVLFVGRKKLLCDEDVNEKFALLRSATPFDGMDYRQAMENQLWHNRALLYLPLIVVLSIIKYYSKTIQYVMFFPTNRISFIMIAI